MNEINLPDDIHLKSLKELTTLADKIIENLENKKDLENSINEYQKLLKLNTLIEKKFQTTSKEISENTKSLIKDILKKKMKKKLNKIAKDTNKFLTKYLKSQKKTDLIIPMKYGLLPGGKKIRSKILVDVGKIFNIKYNTLIQVGAAIECIHAYSLIHDDLPCMDNDNLRRGKLSTHKKFGESTAILAGNSLLTIAFEILGQKNFSLNDNIKIKLITLLSECSGHSGVAGGQFSDLNFERKKIPLKKIIEMQVKKTGKLFSFCCTVPVIINKKIKHYKKFDKIGSKIGLLFQITDDLIDYKGKTKKAGKKTNKDKRIGKATLISLLGYENTIKYSEKLKLNIFKNLDEFGNKASDLKDTIEYITVRSK